MAGGSYTDSVNGQQLDAVTLSGGSWSAARVPLPTGASGSQAGAFSTGVTCVATGSCLILGVYNDANLVSQGVIDTLSSGTWTPTEIAFTQVQPAGVALTAAETPQGVGYCYACGAQGTQGTATKSPINTESGNFFHTFTDISVVGRSYALAVTRTYSSQAAAANGPFGFGWQFNYGMSLALSGISPNQIVTITQEDGGQITFKQPSSGSSWPPAAPRFIATLIHNADSTWTFTRQARDTYTFNVSGQLTKMVDLNGYTTGLSYTGAHLTMISDPAGRLLSVGWTGATITSLTDANMAPTRTVTYQYNDGNGNLTDVIDVNGGTTHLVYDASHRVTVMKDPVCQSLGAACPGVQNHYDASARVDWQKDQLNRQTTFGYSGTPGTAAGGTTTTTDPKGNVVLEGYQFGIRTYVTRGYGTPSAATTSFLFDPMTLVQTAVVDANGGISSQSVGGTGNVLSSTDPLGRTTVTTYNALNEPLTSQDPKGVITTMTYDPKGNLLTKSTPCPDCTPSATQLVTYQRSDVTHPGDVTAMIDPDNKTWQYGYDSHGYRNAVTDPLGNKATSTFNPVGWKLTDVSPKGNVSGCNCAATYTTAYGYVIPHGTTTDEFGDVQTITDPLGHVTTLGYDSNRNKTSTQDPDGNQTVYLYDVANEPVQTKRADSPQTTLTTDYNSDGTVLDRRDGKGTPIQTFGYDTVGRTTTATDALSNVTTYSYDSAGNALTRQDPAGSCPSTNCTTMTYDAAGQLQTITYTGGVTPNVTSTTYDPDGQRTAMTDGTGTSSWTWDSLHRMTSYKNGKSSQLQWAYDLRNLVTTVTYPNSKAVSRVIDDAGRVKSVKDWLATPNTTTFGYDPNSNVTSDTLQSTIQDTYVYDAANNLASIADMKGSTTIFSTTYSRDANGQLTADTSAQSSQSQYKYTTLNQVCYAGSVSSNACSSPPSSSYPYGYDAADNLTKMENSAHSGSNTQQFNAADELCWTVSGSSNNSCTTVPSAATTYGYDTRGNRVAAVRSTGAGTCTVWDQADRLSSIATGTGVSCTTPTTVGTYSYNGDGLRMSKTVASTTTQFTWDDSGPVPVVLQEKAGSASPTFYIYGPSGSPIEQIDPSATAHFYAHDQLGSTRALTSSTGAVEDTATYDPYGNGTSSTGTITNHLQFQGQYLDSESGLYYLRARYYDPTTAQFLTRDPMVDTTRSPYGYVAGNPLNATDPSGECGLFGNDTCLGDAAGAVASAWNATGGQIVNNIQNFANSSHTLGVCASVSGSLFVGGGNAQVCGVVRFQGTTPVGFATTETLGAGAGPGLGFTGLLEVQGSNAPNLKSLGGPFAYIAGSGGAGPAVGGSFAEGVGSCGPFSVGSVGVGAGLGGGVQVGPDYTWVQTWFGS
jgi:RHS repeat-associated protein